jgi:hypothetical protein
LANAAAAAENNEMTRAGGFELPWNSKSSRTRAAKPGAASDGFFAAAAFDDLFAGATAAAAAGIGSRHRAGRHNARVGGR